MRPLVCGLSLTSALLVVACGSSTKSNTSPDAGIAKASIATAAAGALTVELLTDTQLETGLTPVYLKITTPTGDMVNDAVVTFMPVMSMSGGMNHSCPMMGPPALGADGLYRVDVVFSMASTAADTWSATVGVSQFDGGVVEATFPSLTVIDSGRAKPFTYTDAATSVATRYIASLNFVTSPKVGLNPIVFTLHTRQDMMTFPPVNDAIVVLNPEMPSMGHGSPGSVDPTLTAPGRYEGQLSFSMAGDWQTTISVTSGGVAVGEPVFSTSF